MELREFTADDAESIRIAVEIENAHHATDSPWQHPQTAYRQEMEMRHGWDGEVSRWFLAYAGQVPVGLGSVGTSEWDNLDLAWLGLAVHPDHRRRGHGTRALAQLLEVAGAMGRHVVGIDAWEDLGAAAFAATTGFAPKAQAINRRMALDGVDLADVRRLRDDAAGAATSYELVRITGRTPDDLLEVVSQMTAAINDAPTDDLEVEDENYPPERIRAYEDAQLLGGSRLYRLVARHRGSGELSGHTVVSVDVERPALAEQHDTSVVQAHRGHRLGLLLKAEMVLWLAEAEPQVATVDTWNAESNAQMIAVNDVLGYQVMGREIQYQRHV